MLSVEVMSTVIVE